MEEGGPAASGDAPSSQGPCAVEVAETLSGVEIAELCKSDDGSPFLCAGVQSHFYQKFENEQEGRQKALQDMSKRDKMLELMQTGDWALEVSLKHSGSLGHFDGEVMWGKNSTDSEYTAAFENQLFDCFRRAQPLGPEGTAKAVEKFRMFCETLRAQSITVAFEAVCREILGDHGQLPLLNYLVVTAVVDKAEPFHSRFRDSRRLIEFCVEWGLPWNETFLFTTVESFQQYWDIYDGMSRDGTATEILRAMDKAADTALACPVPHMQVQGEILEGMVARMVPKFEVEGLVQNAKATADALPLDRLVALSAELDDVWTSSGKDTEAFKVAAQKRVSVAFPVVLNGRMSQEATDRLTIGLLQCSGHGHKTTDQLCELLREIWQPPEKRGTGKQRSQVHLKGFRHVNGDVFIIVHVASDALFEEVNKTRTDEQMPLYRGFVLRLSAKTAGESEQAYQQLLGESSPVALAHHRTVHLMVKCKTVRYKLMTFIFRKGAQLYMKNIVNDKGASAAMKRYVDNVAHYFRQWSSDDAEEEELQRKYSRWVMGWPSWLQGQIDAKELDPKAFLEGQSYLRLAKTYNEWYEQQAAPEAAPFRGIMFITYPTTKVPEDDTALHRALQARFGFRLSTIANLKELTRSGMLALVGSAVIVPVAIAERTPPNDLQSLLAGYSTDICWLSASATGASAIDPATVNKGDLKRIFNVAPRWCKMLASIVTNEAHRFVDDATTTLVEQAKPPYDELVLLSQFRTPENNEEAFAAAASCLAFDRPKLELARHTVVVYPSIPGTAKTSLLVDDALKQLQAEIGSLDCNHDMVIIHGDAPEEKHSFWRRLDERIAARRPYITDGGCNCIFVCDKNCPPGLPNEAPGTDGLHRQIAMSKPKGSSIIFVVPESPGYSSENEHNAYCLDVLVVGMSRVFKRTDHQNLKGANSPMTMMMFYNLYNHVTRERFMSRLRWLGEVVELPVIKRSAAGREGESEEAMTMTTMPEDLRTLLVAGRDLDKRKQAIVARSGGSKGRSKGKGKGSRGGAALPPDLLAEIDGWVASVPAAFEKHDAYIESIQVDRGEAATAFATKLREAIASAIQRPIDGAAAGERMPTYCGAFVERAPITEALAAAGAAETPDDVEWQEELHCTLLHTNDPKSGGSLDSMQALVGKEATVVVDAL
jgi:hypothetical protein